MPDLSRQLRSLAATAPATYNGNIARALAAAADEIDRLNREKHELTRRLAELVPSEEEATP